MELIFIDNFDSFSYNLTDELATLGCKLRIYRNDVAPQFIVDELSAAAAHDSCSLVISPGPGTPKEAGNLLAIIGQTIGQFPILGVCLGHQAIAQYLGAKIVRAPEICHGKASAIMHDNGPLFTGLANPLQAARYHSLIVTDLPKTLTCAAKAGDLCMAYYAKYPRVIGLQFHPESILTTQGRHVLRNCLNFLQS